VLLGKQAASQARQGRSIHVNGFETAIWAANQFTALIQGTAWAGNTFLWVEAIPTQ
jgi:hypothetical protein